MTVEEISRTVVKATDIKVGGRITETDTPDGTFYDVVKVNPQSVVVSAYDITLRLPIRATDTVRKATS